MKQRFSYLDLRLVTNEVQRELTNCYLQNVYSLENSSRHFLLKFDAGVHQTGKRFLMVDPGMRFHLTNYQHEPTKQPSHFVQKLRKYLKNRRATNFWVAPASRLLVITFTEGQFYLVFEFFAGGNLILLDKDRRILTLFRVVRDVGPDHRNHQIGEEYNLEMPAPAEGTGSPEANSAVANSANTDGLQQLPSLETLRGWVAKDKLGKALYSKISDPSSSLIEYCLREKGLDPKQKVPSDLDDKELDRIMDAVKMSLDKAHELMTQDTPTPGYILFDKDGNSVEFEPFPEYFRLVHPENRVDELPTYNATVDKYFGAILSDKGVNKVEQLHSLAESRLEAARNERYKRVEGLVQQQERNEKMGNTLQENADTVDAAISAAKALVDQGADWGDAEKLIQLEKEKGNVIAQAIHSLQLDKLQITLLLDDLKIPVNIDKSAHANARDYFELRRSALLKIDKTEQHASKALKSAEIKIKRDLELNLAKHRQAGVAAQLHAIRTPHWFEKFWWFLTSTGHLVIAAKDDMQCNLLIRRYFLEGDLVLTSDVPEASVLIIKNNAGGEIPPQALLQAGAFCVATSDKSWEAKSKAPSWFLTRKQVPKLNKEGDLTSVSDIRRITPRNLVPPTQIEMGMALLWQCESPAEDNEDSSSEIKDESEDEDEFPDTQFDSDDDFPDTRLDSDDDSNDSHSSDEVSDNEANGNEANSNEVSDEDVSDKAPSPKTSVSPSDSDVDELGSASQSDTKSDGSGSEAESDLQEDEPNTDGPPSPQSNPPSISSSHKEPQQPAFSVPKKVRGNKKKLRKYMFQDEEDRINAMERLGTMKGLQRKAEEQEAKERAKLEQQELVRKRKERQRKADLAFLSEDNSTSEKQTYPSDLLYRYDESEPIVAAVPMFGPWSSLQKAQYKVKLVFGSLKRGKASSEILKVLLKTGTKPASEREQKLVDAVRQVDVQQLISVSRLQIATVTSVKNSKSGSKSSASGGKSGKTSSNKKKK